MSWLQFPSPHFDLAIVPDYYMRDIQRALVILKKPRQTAILFSAAEARIRCICAESIWREFLVYRVDI
jgi:hypothetical protein